MFLEPVLPAPRVLVVGETPTAEAVLLIGAQLGLDAVERAAATTSSRGLEISRSSSPRTAATSCTRCAAGLEAGLPYVGLVASPKRGTGVLAELRGDGVPEEQLARIDVPAGLDIGARTPAEIALSILAKIVAVRRDGRAARRRRDALCRGRGCRRPAAGAARRSTRSAG